MPLLRSMERSHRPARSQRATNQKHSNEKNTKVSSSHVLNKYKSSLGPTQSGKSQNSRGSQETKTKLLKSVDDAIENGATDEAKEKAAAGKYGFTGKWKTFDEHIEDESKKRAEHKKEAGLRLSRHREEAKRMIEKKQREKNKKNAAEARRKENEKELREKERERNEKELRERKRKEAEREHRRHMKEEEKKRLENDKNAKEEERKKKAIKQRQDEQDPNSVERIPKRSALLAMGGSGLEEYRKELARKSLETWTDNLDKWFIQEATFDGKSTSETKVQEKLNFPSTDEAILTFKENPEKYIAMFYPLDISERDLHLLPTPFIFILRAGTTSYHPTGLRSDGSGSFAIFQHFYRRLRPLKGDLLPKTFRDKFTDDMTFEGRKLHSETKKAKLPLLPGRGMGLCDDANMKLIGDVADPNDVFQGFVGDCWLLSAIACLADFDWAVKRLFRKTKSPGLKKRPVDDPNQYIVTLWDLQTWDEVDIVVDERLPIRPDASGFLLGAKPSKNGKLWVPYLEKAIAIHCGGYDKIVGGNCTNAWPMLTGSRNQYIIQKNTKTNKYFCSARFNMEDEDWMKQSNSPHDSDQTVWKVNWPKIRSGEGRHTEVTKEELFHMIVVWDETNFLIGAGTNGSSDKNSTNGIVDNHAYSVIDSRKNIAGTGIDLLLVRNPWGEGGGLKNGKFMPNGPGWTTHPEVKEELNPAPDDMGMFWLTKEEFFIYFQTIYLCAFNMARLKDKNYKNDLTDTITRRGKDVKKSLQEPLTENLAPLEPWVVNKMTDPNSRYKIVEKTYDTSFSYLKMKKRVVKGMSIPEGIEEFRAHPEKYLAIHYQTSMVEGGWPVHVHQFTFVYREGTEGIEMSSKGKKRTMLMNVLK